MVSSSSAALSPVTAPPPGSDAVAVDVGPLGIEDVVRVARGGAPVRLTDEALAGIEAARRVVEDLAEQVKPVYGVSTGFGALATRHIPAEQRAALQRSLIRSHAAGTGAEVPAEVVRATMLLRLSTLATGRTGVRVDTARRYADMLNAGVTPLVYEHGSLGCSGDLAPLAHIALVAMGEGEARVGPEGAVLSGGEALAAAGLAPVDLVEKEGLALVNGTDGMLGMLCLAIHDLTDLYRMADVALSLTLQALEGSTVPFDERLVALRPQAGQQVSARNVRALVAGSELVSHDGSAFPRVQDAYSIRCHPQVAGAGRDTVAHAAAVAAAELASAIDNPVVTDDGRTASNGNFHGAPVGYVLDFLAIAAADLASICERRLDRLLDANRSHGLPPFLASDPGLDSGGMIGQYTAAGIVSELKRLAVPASVDSIPTSAMQEDHVSMGWSAALKLRRAVEGLRTVVAIEILFAARAIELRERRPSVAAQAVIGRLRSRVEGVGPDRFLAPEIAAARDLVADGTLWRAVAECVPGLE